MDFDLLIDEYKKEIVEILVTIKNKTKRRIRKLKTKQTSCAEHLSASDIICPKRS